MNANKTLTDLTRDIVNLRDKNKDCIICGKPICPWQESEICHYIKRRHISTTWDLLNVAKGHKSCNQLEESSELLQDSHRMNVLDRIDSVEFMRLNVNKNKTVHLSPSDKLEMIKNYREILKQMKTK